MRCAAHEAPASGSSLGTLSTAALAQGERRQRMTVYRLDIDRTACAAAGTVHVKPRHAGHDCTTDCRRPQRPLRSCNSGILALDHALRLVTRFPLGRSARMRAASSWLRGGSCSRMTRGSVYRRPRPRRRCRRVLLPRGRFPGGMAPAHSRSPASPADAAWQPRVSPLNHARPTRELHPTPSG